MPLTQPKTNLAYFRSEKAKAEQKLRSCQHREKILERQMSELNRRERVHRLCTRAGMLESFLVCPPEPCRLCKSHRRAGVWAERSRAGKYASENIRIGCSVGAKAKNHVVVDKSTGEEYYSVEGTRTQNTQVFAGKGGVKPLHKEVAQGFAAEFGGLPED